MLRSLMKRVPAMELASKQVDTAPENKGPRALCLGLDGAGKTTLLYALKLGETVATIPTIGFNVEEIPIGRYRVTIWDVGGQPKLLPLWRHYYQGTNLLLFVVDANDKERLQEAGKELTSVLQAEEMLGVPLVLVCNKSDLPHALPPTEVVEHMGVDSDLLLAHLKETVSSSVQQDASPVRDALSSVLSGKHFIAQSEPVELDDPTLEPTITLMDRLLSTNQCIVEYLLKIYFQEKGQRTDFTPYSPSAVCFGGEGKEEEEAPRALPHEVISIITSYIPFEELFPSSLWYFSRGKAGGRVWAVGKTWLYAALNALQQRVIGDEELPKATARLISAVTGMKLPPPFLALQIAVVSCCVESLEGQASFLDLCRVRMDELLPVEDTTSVPHILRVPLIVSHCWEFAATRSLVYPVPASRLEELLTRYVRVKGHDLTLFALPLVTIVASDMQVAVEWLGREFGGTDESCPTLPPIADADLPPTHPLLEVPLSDRPALEKVQWEPRVGFLGSDFGCVELLRRGNFYEFELTERGGSVSREGLTALWHLLEDTSSRCRYYEMSFQLPFCHMEALIFACSQAASGVKCIRVEVLGEDGTSIAKDGWEELQKVFAEYSTALSLRWQQVELKDKKGFVLEDSVA